MNTTIDRAAQPARAAHTAPAPRARRAPVPSAVLGTLIFVVTEVMFFSGLISAFTISRAGAAPGTWPAPGQPTLPAAATAFNTALLLASGAALFFARRLRARGGDVRRALTTAWALGAMFVALQGREWATLLAQGLTLTSSRLGAFFYLIVGMHAAHAVVALAVLGVAGLRLRRGTLTPGFFAAAQVFWYFVVLMWPVVYGRVYF